MVIAGIARKSGWGRTLGARSVGEGPGSEILIRDSLSAGSRGTTPLRAGSSLMDSSKLIEVGTPLGRKYSSSILLLVGKDRLKDAEGRNEINGEVSRTLGRPNQVSTKARLVVGRFTQEHQKSPNSFYVTFTAYHNRGLLGCVDGTRPDCVVIWR